MLLIHRVATTLTIAGTCAASALAQAPPVPSPAPAPRTTSVTAPRRLAPTEAPSHRRSVVHHNPYPYPNYYHNDETAGFRNPGGTGRYREYYPPGDQSQLNSRERDPVQVAKFDQGGGAPDRAEQLQAESAGVQRYNSLQQHIDNYARPAFGFGYGVGGFGGFY